MAQQFNIDQTAFSLESSKATVQTVSAMKAANKELKNVIRQDLDIDAVDDLADDMAELMDDFNEINEALGQNYATPDDIDEADLDAELEMLGDELDELEEEEATPSYLMPATPSVTPGGANKEDGDKVDEYGIPTAPIGQHN